MNILRRIKKHPYFLLISFVIVLILIIFFLVASYRIFSSEGRKAFREGNSLIKIMFDKVPEPEPVIILKAEKTIVVPEGWRNSDINSYLKDKLNWSDESLFGAVGNKNVFGSTSKQDFSLNWLSNFPFLEDKPDNLSLEGYLFPDTYRVYASSSPEDVVYKMLSNLDDKLSDQMKEDIKKQGRTIHEILTMASIIEKEAPIYAQTDSKEAKIISGIFWNRINIGMGLQSDATLSYIFDDKKPVHSGDELEVDSLYNTYKYRGLPPGPICNPGIIAIEAAIYPAKTSYYYFLTSLDGKNIYYAKTYQEHLNNKYKYLK